MRVVTCKLVRTKQIYMQTQIQTQTQTPRGDDDIEITEQERTSGRRRDKIWAKNILINTGLVILSCWMVSLYIDTSPLFHVIAKIFHFMQSYMDFSIGVLCDIVSFIVGIIFIIMFVLASISIILLSCIAFTAFIFAFTSI